MAYKIIQTETYLKKLKRFLKKHPDVLDSYAKTIEIMTVYPYHPSLRLHKLQGRLQTYHSVSINMKYRVVIDFVITEDSIIPIDVGSHDEVY